MSLSAWISRISAWWDPAMYQGWNRRRRYFEGWYFKAVDPAGEAPLAVIPGISIGRDGDRHAFVQVLDGRDCQSDYTEFDATSFLPAAKGFDLRVGDNHFSARGMTLDLPWVQGELRFRESVPWPGTWLAPGIMGWYSFAPMMECYHGLVSMHHTLEGSLRLRDRSVDFNGGKGYIEKDWGQSFPRCWIWTHSNHFDSTPNASLMASVAHIPWMGNYFIGHLVALWIEGVWYRFATYTGARYSARIEGEVVYLTFTDKRNRLELTAYPGPGAALRSPITGHMTGKVNESLQGVIQATLYEGNRILFQSTGRHAGLEVAGDTAVLCQPQ